MWHPKFFISRTKHSLSWTLGGSKKKKYGSRKLLLCPLQWTGRGNNRTLVLRLPLRLCCLAIQQSNCELWDSASAKYRTSQSSDQSKLLYGNHHSLLLGNLDEQEQLYLQGGSAINSRMQKNFQVWVPLAVMQSKEEILSQNSRMDRQLAVTRRPLVWPWLFFFFPFLVP